MTQSSSVSVGRGQASYLTIGHVSTERYETLGIAPDQPLVELNFDELKGLLATDLGDTALVGRVATLIEQMEVRNSTRAFWSSRTIYVVYEEGLFQGEARRLAHEIIRAAIKRKSRATTIFDRY